MNPTIGIALLLTVLQVARGQKVTSLTACLVNQSLRLDCHHENTTTTPMQYEFSLTRDTKKWVLSGSNGVTRPEYSSRTKFFSKYNLKVLYLSNFTTKDEGTYTCELRLSGPNPTVSNKDVSVFRGHRMLARWKQREAPLHTSITETEEHLNNRREGLPNTQGLPREGQGHHHVETPGLSLANQQMYPASRGPVTYILQPPHPSAHRHQRDAPVLCLQLPCCYEQVCLYM